MEINVRKYDLSVILALYNSKKFLLRAVNSVLSQTFSDYELILVDDGSVDNIEEILFPVLKLNDNFKYLRHSNRGHPLSLNAGIMNSTGRLITFLDSDDEYEANHLEERVNVFLNDPAVDLIHSPATIIGNAGDFYVPDANDRNRLIHINECIIGGTLFGKREVFEKLEGFRNVYSHDSDFYERAVKVFNVKKLDSPTYIYYRDNPDSVLNKLKRAANEH